MSGCPFKYLFYALVVGFVLKVVQDIWSHFKDYFGRKTKSSPNNQEEHQKTGNFGELKEFRQRNVNKVGISSGELDNLNTMI